MSEPSSSLLDIPSADHVNPTPNLLPVVVADGPIINELEANQQRDEDGETTESVSNHDSIESSSSDSMDVLWDDPPIAHPVEITEPAAPHQPLQETFPPAVNFNFSLPSGSRQDMEDTSSETAVHLQAPGKLEPSFKSSCL